MAPLVLQAIGSSSEARPGGWLDRRVLTKAALATVSVFAVATISATAAGATITLYVPPTGPHPQVSKPVVDLTPHGPGMTYYASTAQQIGYPASLYPFEGTMALDLSVAAGVEALDAVIRAIPAGEPIQIIGASQGDVVLTMEQRLLLENPPANNDITFIRFADPTSPTGLMGRFDGFKLPGYTAVRMTETPYDTVVITRQYDGIADWPADSLNILADINALIGGVLLHDQSKYGVDPTTIPAYDITTTTNKYGATTTTYLIENTGLLPILVPLQNLGVDQKVLDALQGPLKKIIDAGYSTAWSPLHKLVAMVGTKAFRAVVNTISQLASDVGVVLRKLDALGTRLVSKAAARSAASIDKPPAVNASAATGDAPTSETPKLAAGKRGVVKTLVAKLTSAKAKEHAAQNRVHDLKKDDAVRNTVSGDNDQVRQSHSPRRGGVLGSRRHERADHTRASGDRRHWKPRSAAHGS